MIAATLGLLLAAPAAGAYIFWSAYDSGNSKIGRADSDGGNVNQELVNGIYFGQGVATDGTHVYWGSSGSSPSHAHIGRAGVDGSSPEQGYLDAATFCGVFDIVATPAELYWLKDDCSGLSFHRRIDGAVLGGGGGYTEVGAGSSICGFDVDANYAYWSEGHYISRAALPGPSLPEYEWLDVGASVAPCAIAVDSGHVYWTTLLGSPTFRGADIGRANIDGNPSSVENAVITGAAFISASGIDIGDGHLYWTNLPLGGVTGSVGRANLDGTGVDQTFIPNLFDPGSLAVDSAGPGSGGPGTTPGGGGSGGSSGGGSGSTPPPPAKDTKPPETTITKKKIKAAKRRARFSFKSNEVGSSFKCKLDGQKAASCSSPKVYKGLSPGSHTFKVTAADAAGNVDPSPAVASFTIPK